MYKKIMRLHFCSYTFPRHLISYNWEKMEQILQVFAFPKEIVTMIIMRYKNTKEMACSPDDDIDFFDIYIYIYIYVCVCEYIDW